MTIDGLPTTIKPEDVDPSQRKGSGAMSVLIGPANWMPGAGILEGIKGATGLPGYGTKSRDAILRASMQLDPMWRAAVFKAVTKYVSMGYTVKDSTDSPRRLAYAQEIIRSYDGGNYSRGLTKGMQDYLLTNWGQVVYIDRPKRGSRVQGLYHLDSLRCYPYPHPDYPMLYYSPIRGGVLLRGENIIHVSSMTHPDPAYYNLGHCAADAIWSDLLLMVAMQTYTREKISGTRNLALHFITGVAPEQLRNALNESDEAREQRGFVVYKGSTIIPMLPSVGGDGPQLITIPLAEVPDGFNADELKRDFYLRCSNVVGIPVQEIQPLSGQGLGTGTQTQVLDDAANAQGLAAYAKEWPEQVSWKALPETSTYQIIGDDLRDQKLKAEVQERRAATRAARIASGEITIDEARQIAFDSGDLSQELFAVADQTAGGQLTDTQKPVVVDESTQSLLTEGVRAMQERRAAAAKRGAGDAAAKEIFGYHIETGVVGRNEARAALGLPPEPQSDDDALRRMQAKLSVLKAATDAGIELGQALALVGLQLPTLGAAQVASQGAPNTFGDQEATKAARVRRYAPDAVEAVEDAALALLEEVRGG